MYSALTFNGYTFPYGFSLDGADQDVTLDAAQLLKTHGSVFTPPTFKQKIVKVSGYIGGNGAVDSNGVLIQNRDDAKAELNRLALAIGNGYGQLSIGNVASPRTLRCQLQNMIVTPHPQSNQSCLAVSLAFVAPDPRWLGPMNVFTFHTPDTLGTNPPMPMHTLGNAWSFPIFTFYGPITWTSFAVASVGINMRYLLGGGQYSGLFNLAARTLPSGQTFIIDSQPQNRANAVLFNGVTDFTMIQGASYPDFVDYDQPDLFPVIYPGSGFEPHFGSPTPALCSIAWQDAWWA